MSLSYSLLYNPNIKSDENVNFVCSDNKIHIRLDNFNHPQLIMGFERKLTYLITYLFNYSYLPKVVEAPSDKALFESFLKSVDMLVIGNYVYNYVNRKFKGFKLTKNYKKLPHNEFGDVPKSCFPLTYDNGVLEAGDLQTFLTTFNVKINDYLFDDRYMILLTEISDNKLSKLNKKFKNKDLKKQRYCIDNQDIDVVQLW